MSSAVIDIRIEPAESAQDRVLVGELTDLVNAVYTDAERGLWVDGADRTSTREMAGLIARHEIAVGRLGGRVVGAVRIQRMGNGVGEFGMLVADPARRGIGVGRELVRFAERSMLDQGLETMQLELLVPRTWTHPIKAFLHDWYTRLGYVPVRTGHLDEAYPHLAPLLATPCDFVIYTKRLGP